MIDPDNCTTMMEVRVGVDAVDRELATLLGRRFRYMDAAARIKPKRGQVRDGLRKADVLANARANAAAVSGSVAERSTERAGHPSGFRWLCSRSGVPGGLGFGAP